jgi:dihydrofolate reductase
LANYVYIAVSLDGYIATPGGGLDWLDEIPNPDGSDFGFADFMEGIDALVMGRNTFLKVLTFGFWPYEKPVFVPSNAEIVIPKELKEKVQRVKGTPVELVTRLGERGYKNLYVDGGLTIQGFLEADLIDELIITRVPVLLGDGIPLFGKLQKILHFKHKTTEVLNETLIKSHYVRIKE